MKVEAKLFEFLTAFFFLAGILYTVVTAIWGPGYGYGAVEWVGVTGMFLTGGLTLIIGTYFRFVSNRVDTRPEDYEDAEVSDGAGELGFFSPHSWWPLVLGFATFLVVLGLVFAVWVVVLGVAVLLLALVGWLFEYYRGDFAV